VVMESLYTHLNGAAGASSIAVALIAVSGAIFGAITSWIISGRNTYINSITTERNKWIEKLRSNIATFSNRYMGGSYEFVVLLKARDDKVTAEEQGTVFQLPSDIDIKGFRERDEIAALIRLQLNPGGIIDGHILNLLHLANSRGIEDAERVGRTNALLIAHSQWLLKAEWEKVKFEGGGPLYRLLHLAAPWWHLRKYRTFLKGEGSYSDLQQTATKRGLPLVTS